MKRSVSRPSIATAWLMAAAATTLGCGPAIVADEFTIDLCSASSVADLAPTAPIDGIELRFGNEVIAHSGVLCGAASDAERCRAEVAKLDETAGIRVHDVVARLVFTRESEVGAVTDVAGLLAFLGPIEAATDARLVAFFHGYTPACRLRRSGNGFEAYAETLGGTCGRAALIVRIDESGHVAQVDSEELTPGTDSCR